MPLSILDDLRKLLISGSASTQDEIRQALIERGHEVNQSKVSRTLRKIGAVKGKNEHGDIVYRIPFEPAPPTLDETIASLVLEITHNEQLIVVSTCPGSAQFIARMIDYHKKTLEVLGSIAGDDTILIIPAAVKKLSHSFKLVKQLLAE